MVFYFTATGNSLYVAKQLEENPESIAQLQESKGLSFEDDKIGIIYPNFGGNPPKVVQDFIKNNSFRTDYFYMIATYGFRAGASVDNAYALCEECGITLDYFHTVFMTDNYLPNFDIENELRMDKDEEGQIAKIKADIEAKKRVVILSTPEEIEARRQHLLERRAKMAAERGGRPAPDTSNGKLFCITDACIGCGTCSRVCPEGDYVIKDGKALHTGEYCLGCLACVHNCPQKAIRLTIPEKNENARYRNPHVTLGEIISANCRI